MKMTTGERLLPWAFCGCGVLCVVLALAAELYAQSARSSVAVAHRHTQARTDSQPTLPDDLANDKKRPDGSGGLGNPASQDIGAVVGQALEAAKPAVREIIVHNMPPKHGPCPFCVQQRAIFGNGWGDVRVSYTDSDDPRFTDRGYPFVEIPDAGRVLSVSRVYQRAEIEAALQAYKPPVVPQAMSVGTLRVRSQVDRFLSMVKPGKNGPEIVVGSARILMPTEATVKERIAPETYTRVYVDKQPTYVYGIVSVPVSEMTLSRNKLRLSAGGWPVELDVIE